MDGGRCLIMDSGGHPATTLATEPSGMWPASKGPTRAPSGCGPPKPTALSSDGPQQRTVAGVIAPGLDSACFSSAACPPLAQPPQPGVHGPGQGAQQELRTSRQGADTTRGLNPDAHKMRNQQFQQRVVDQPSHHQHLRYQDQQQQDQLPQQQHQQQHHSQAGYQHTSTWQPGCPNRGGDATGQVLRQASRANLAMQPSSGPQVSAPPLPPAHLQNQGQPWPTALPLGNVQQQQPILQSHAQQQPQLRRHGQEQPRHRVATIQAASMVLPVQPQGQQHRSAYQAQQQQQPQQQPQHAVNPTGALPPQPQERTQQPAQQPPQLHAYQGPHHEPPLQQRLLLQHQLQQLPGAGTQPWPHQQQQQQGMQTQLSHQHQHQQQGLQTPRQPQEPQVQPQCELLPWAEPQGSRPCRPPDPGRPYYQSHGQGGYNPQSHQQPQQQQGQQQPQPQQQQQQYRQHAAGWQQARGQKQPYGGQVPPPQQQQLSLQARQASRSEQAELPRQQREYEYQLLPHQHQHPQYAGQSLVHQEQRRQQHVGAPSAFDAPLAPVAGHQQQRYHQHYQRQHVLQEQGLHQHKHQQQQSLQSQAQQQQRHGTDTPVPTCATASAAAAPPVMTGTGMYEVWDAHADSRVSKACCPAAAPALSGGLCPEAPGTDTTAVQGAVPQAGESNGRGSGGGSSGGRGGGGAGLGSGAGEGSGSTSNPKSGATAGSGGGSGGVGGSGGGDDKDQGTPGKCSGGGCCSGGGARTPSSGRRGAKKVNSTGGAGAGTLGPVGAVADTDDDETIPAVNPFLRFASASPPSADKRSRVAISPPPQREGQGAQRPSMQQSGPWYKAQPRPAHPDPGRGLPGQHQQALPQTAPHQPPPQPEQQLLHQQQRLLPPPQQQQQPPQQKAWQPHMHPEVGPQGQPQPEQPLLQPQVPQWPPQLHQPQPLDNLQLHQLQQQPQPKPQQQLQLKPQQQPQPQPQPQSQRSESAGLVAAPPAACGTATVPSQPAPAPGVEPSGQQGVRQSQAAPYNPRLPRPAWPPPQLQQPQPYATSTVSALAGGSSSASGAAWGRAVPSVSCAALPGPPPVSGAGSEAIQHDDGRGLGPCGGSAEGVEGQYPAQLRVVPGRQGQPQTQAQQRTAPAQPSQLPQPAPAHCGKQQQPQPQHHAFTHSNGAAAQQQRLSQQTAQHDQQHQRLGQHQPHQSQQQFHGYEQQHPQQHPQQQHPQPSGAFVQQQVQQRKPQPQPPLPPYGAQHQAAWRSGAGSAPPSAAPTAQPPSHIVLASQHAQHHQLPQPRYPGPHQAPPWSQHKQAQPPPPHPSRLNYQPPPANSSASHHTLTHGSHPMPQHAGSHPQAPPAKVPPAVGATAATGFARGSGAYGNGSDADGGVLRRPPDIRGRCPYDRCPGVYQPCNADLLWISPPAFIQPHAQPVGPPPALYEPIGYWRCSRYPECGWRYYPHPRLREPVLSLEIVGDHVFKVMPFPGAEDAVSAAGGVACVMAGAGLDLSAALTRDEARKLLLSAAPAAATGGSTGPVLDPGGSHLTGGPTAAAAASAAPSAVKGASEEGAASESAMAAEAKAAARGAAGATAAGTRVIDPADEYFDDSTLCFPLDCYERLLAPLPPHSSLFNAGSLIPEPVRKAYRGQFCARESALEVAHRMGRMPPSLRVALMPFQQQGVEFGLARHGRCLIADEMGVGKTVQAIALASCYEEEWPLLCIVPASLRLVWAEELEKWLPHLRPSHIHVIEGKANRLTGRMSRGQALPRVTITSYEMMRRLTCPACSKMKSSPPPPSATAPPYAAQSAGAGSDVTPSATSASGADQGAVQAAVKATGDADAGATKPTGAAARKGSSTYGAGRGGGCGVGGGCKAACWGADRCMAAMPWGMVIVDESHNLRTTNSRDADSPHTEACTAAVSRARRAVLLSGTPSLSRPFDLFRQVDALHPGLLGASKQAFAFRYCDGRMVPHRISANAARPFRGATAASGAEGFGGGGGGGMAPPQRKRLETSGGSRLYELHGLLTREVMIRRLKRDIMAQLPPKRRQVVRLPYPKSWPDAAPKPQPADGATADGESGSGNQHAVASAATTAGRAAAVPTAEGIRDGGLGGRPGGREKGRGGRGAGAGTRGGRAGGRGRPAKRARVDAEGDDGSGSASASTAAAASAAGEAEGGGDEDEDEDGDGGGDGDRAEEHQEGASEDDGSDVEGGGTDAGGGAGGPAAAAGQPASSMTSAHRTALAKLPDAISWLVGALGGGGVVQEGGGGGRTGGGRIRRQQQQQQQLANGQAAAAAVGEPGTSASRSGASGGSSSAGGQQPPGEQLPKFLVFAHHRDVMDRLAEALQGFDGAEGGGGDDDDGGPGGGGGGSGGAVWQGVHYVRIDGSHDSAERRMAVMRFRDDPTVRVALLSITAAAVGLDFSAASAVVFVELPNEVSLLQQAEDRAHRKGQTHNCVNVYFLCAKGTCDDKRWQKLNESLNNITQVHDGSAAAPGGVGGGSGAGEPGSGTDGGGGNAASAVVRTVRGLTVDAVVDLEEQGAAAVPVTETGVGGSQHADAERAVAATVDVPAVLWVDAAAPKTGAAAGTAAATAAATTQTTAAAVASHPGRASTVATHQDVSPGDASVEVRGARAVAVPATSAGGGISLAAAEEQTGGAQPGAPSAALLLLSREATAATAAAAAAVEPAATEAVVSGPVPLGLDEQEQPAEVIDLSLDDDPSGAWPDGCGVPPSAAGATAPEPTGQSCTPPPPVSLWGPPQHPATKVSQAGGTMGAPGTPPPLGAAPAAAAAAAASSAVVAPTPLHRTIGAGVNRTSLQGVTQQLHQQPPVPPTPGSAITPSRAALLRMLPPTTTFYFEVSSHTGRLHLHLAADGSRPVGLSLPLELLLSYPKSTMLKSILDEHAVRWSREEAAARTRVKSGPATAWAAGLVQREHQPHLPLPDQRDGQQQPGQPLQSPAPASPPAMLQQRSPAAASPPAEPRPSVKVEEEEERQLGAPGVDTGSGARAEPKVPEPSSAPPAAVIATTLPPPLPPPATALQAPAAATIIMPRRPAGDADVSVYDVALSVQEALYGNQDEKGDARRAARLSFVGPVGLVAPKPSLTPHQLAEGVAEAAAFACDWRELRAVSRNRLYGAVLERYFHDALEAVTSEAIAAGAYGSSTARYVQDAPVKVPEGAILRPVQVRTDARYSSKNNGGGAGGGGGGSGTTSVAGSVPGWRTYQQAFLAAGAIRMCLNCSKAIQDCSLPPEAPLDNTDYLFCDPACETRFFLKASGSALRRTLSRLEHGVCQMCGLDCANLVRQLQTIRTTSRDYLSKRRAVVERLAPRLNRHGYAALLERLLKQATEGLAWQADHITPVYKGGGLCDVDNMRTLCVACHADVTKAQCKQRAAERQQRRLGTRDIRSFWAGGPPSQAGAGNGLPPLPNKRKGDTAAAVPAVPANKRRRAAAARPTFIDTDDDSPFKPLLPPPPALLRDAAAPSAPKTRVKQQQAVGGARPWIGSDSAAIQYLDGPWIGSESAAVQYLDGQECDDDNVWEFSLVEKEGKGRVLGGRGDTNVNGAKVAAPVAGGTAEMDAPSEEAATTAVAEYGKAVDTAVSLLLQEVVDLAGSEDGEEGRRGEGEDREPAGEAGRCRLGAAVAEPSGSCSPPPLPPVTAPQNVSAGAGSDGGNGGGQSWAGRLRDRVNEGRVGVGAKEDAVGADVNAAPSGGGGDGGCAAAPSIGRQRGTWRAVPGDPGSGCAEGQVGGDVGGATAVLKAKEAEGSKGLGGFSGSAGPVGSVGGALAEAVSGAAEGDMASRDVGTGVRQAAAHAQFLNPGTACSAPDRGAAVSVRGPRPASYDSLHPQSPQQPQLQQQAQPQPQGAHLGQGRQTAAAEGREQLPPSAAAPHPQQGPERRSRLALRSRR